MHAAAPVRAGRRGETRVVADRLHSLAVHLLRRLRVVDTESRLSAPRLSALSVIVLGGPVAPSRLAALEQVARPTMTRLVQGLAKDGYVERIADPADRRVTLVSATPKGARVMAEGRRRRVVMLARLLADLPPAELAALGRTVTTLERIAAATVKPTRPRPRRHP